MNKKTFDYIDEAIKLIRERKNEDAFNLINKAIKLSPDKSVLLIFKASLLGRMGKIPQAQKILSKISKNKLELDVLRLLEITEVELLLEQDNYSRANKKINRLIKKYPENHTLFEYKGDVLLGFKKYKLAEAPLKKAHALGHECTSCLGKLGDCYFLRGDLVNAENTFKKLLKKNLKDKVALRKMFQINFKLKKYTKAELFLNRIITESPDGLAFAYKGEIAKIRKDYVGAEVFYRKALAWARKNNEHEDDDCTFYSEIYKDLISVVVLQKKRGKLLELSKEIKKLCPGDKKLSLLLKKLNRI